MKLYTEEQLREAWNTAYVDALALDNKYYKPIFYDDFIASLTPIQLPTDEEIYELAKEQYPISMEKFGNEMMDGNIYFRSIFIQGVEWMRDKIKGDGDE